MLFFLQPPTACVCNQTKLEQVVNELGFPLTFVQEKNVAVDSNATTTTTTPFAQQTTFTTADFSSTTESSEVFEYTISYPRKTMFEFHFVVGWYLSINSEM